MARIETYEKDKVITLNDKVIGTDSDNNGKTANYSVSSFIALINEQNGVSPMYYKYVLGDAPNTPGTFHSAEHTTNISLITNFAFNKINHPGQDVSGWFDGLSQYSNNLALKINDPGNPNNFAVFKITAYTEYPDYYSLDVSLLSQAGQFTFDKIFSLGLDVLDSQSSPTINQDNKTGFLILDGIELRTMEGDETVVNKSVTELVSAMSFEVGEDENLLIKGRRRDKYAQVAVEAVSIDGGGGKTIKTILKYSDVLWRFCKGKGTYTAPNGFTENDFEVLEVEPKETVTINAPALGGPIAIKEYDGKYGVEDNPQGFFNSGEVKAISENEKVLVAPTIQKDNKIVSELWEFTGAAGTYGPGNLQASYADFKPIKEPKSPKLEQNKIVVPLQIGSVDSGKSIVQIFKEKHPYSIDPDINFQDAFKVYPTDLFVINKKDIEKKNGRVYQTNTTYMWNKGEGFFTEGNGHTFKDTDFTEITKASKMIASGTNVSAGPVSITEVVAETPEDVGNPAALLNATGQVYDLSTDDNFYFDVLNPVKSQTYRFKGIREVYSASNPFVEADFELSGNSPALMPTLQEILDNEPFSSVTFPSGATIVDNGLGIVITNGAGTRVHYSNEGGNDLLYLISPDEIFLETNELKMDINGALPVETGYVVARQADGTEKFQSPESLMQNVRIKHNIKEVTASYEIQPQDHTIVCNGDGIQIMFNPTGEDINREICLIAINNIVLNQNFMKYGVLTPGEIPAGSTLWLRWDGANLIQTNA